MSYKLVGIGAVSLSLLLLNGCGQAVDSAPIVGEQSHAEHDHSGWWCAEHGVPEEICSLCSSKVAADFKAKGDWCVEHDRAKSQCFVCEPQQQAKYAAQYEAKFGEQPPKPTM